MKSIVLARLACVAAVVACAREKAPPAPDQLTATSGFRLLPRTEECASGYAATSVRFTVIGGDPVDFDGWPHLVLEEKTSIQRCEDRRRPGQGEVSVAARPADHPEAPPLWTIRRRGDEGAVVDSFYGHALYRVTTHGCCGEESVNAYYALHDGQALFTANNPLLLLDLQAFGTGFVAVHNAHAAEPPGAPDDSTLVAVVAFGMPGGAVQRVAVRCPSNVVALDALELVARDSAGHVRRGRMLDGGIPIDERGGVSIHMQWVPDAHGEPAGEVTIPIENGRMVVERARATAPFRVVTMTER